MRKNRSYIKFAIAIFLGLQLSSCIWGLSIEHKHITDKFYLVAPDLIEQLNISYHYKDQSYFGVVDQTVFAVGFNEDFIIAKQHPSSWDKPINKDTTLYYLIDIRAVKIERENYQEESSSYKMLYKDRNGNDSLGPEISNTSKYSPANSEPLTLEQFENLRKQLNVPDDLDFTMIYDELK
jgi:hypothetical protein